MTVLWIVRRFVLRWTDTKIALNDRQSTPRLEQLSIDQIISELKSIF